MARSISRKHHPLEASKLAFADREAYYADPDYVEVPMDVLLSDEYNDARRKLIDPKRAQVRLHWRPSQTH